MKTKFRISFLAISLLLCFPVFAQKEILADSAKVSQAVTSEIDAVFKSADFMKVKTKKFPDAKGNLIMDIGISQNGKAATFFKVESDIENPLFTNFISDYILQHRFHFTLPKKQHYTVRYTATY